MTLLSRNIENVRLVTDTIVRSPGQSKQHAHGWIFRVHHSRNYAVTTENTENMTLNDNKQDCIKSMVRILERTAEWRKTALAKFDDPRNLKASETLEQLAVDASGLTDEQWADLKPHYAWASQFWRDDLFRAARLVGFAHKSKGFDAFIKLVLRQMSPASLAA